MTLSNTNTYTGATNYSGGNLLTLNAPGGNAIPGNLTLSAHGINTLVLTARELANNQIADHRNVDPGRVFGDCRFEPRFELVFDTIGSLNFINDQGTGLNR